MANTEDVAKLQIRCDEWESEARRLRRVLCDCGHGDDYWTEHAMRCHYRLTMP